MDYSSQLLMALRNEKANQAQGIGMNLANIYNQRQETDFRRNAIKWFGDGEVTADKVQQFLENYPNHAGDVLKFAGEAASRKTAQAMKDAGKSFMDFIKTKDVKKISQQDIMEFVENNPYLAGNQQAQQIFFSQHVPKLMEIQKQYAPEWMELKPDTKYAETIGNVPTGRVMEGATKEDRPYKVGQIIKYEGEGGKVYQGIVSGYSEDGKPQLVDVKDVTKPEKEASEHTVDLGDTVQIRKGGKVTETLKKGVSPSTLASENKPSWIPFRDTDTGAIVYYDKNNPKDRATLQKEGAHLQAIAESPMAPVIREALTPGGSATQKFKTADEVKAAYEKGTLKKEEAVKILRDQFGMK